ncbi:MAG: hypothetical protein FJY98_03060 [Candidatus Liptonbacteria bacterium]|nr:hypothetical protein [Candidatus Liptonbacteria bacterium]
MRFLLVAVGAGAIGITLSYGMVSRLAGHPASLGETKALISQTLKGAFEGKKPLMEISLADRPKPQSVSLPTKEEKKVSAPVPKVEKAAVLEVVPTSTPIISSTASSVPVPPPTPKPIRTCDFETKEASHLVLLNELAWMGMLLREEDEGGGAQAEWIELKNNSGKDLSLAGWKIINKTGKFKIEFETEDRLSEGTFFLLERGNDEAVPEMEADKLYAGVLSNVGDWLRLFDADCKLIDEVDAAHGWAGGENASKKTMERSAIDLSWHTSGNAGGTPKRDNSAVYNKNTSLALLAAPSTPSAVSPSAPLNSASASTTAGKININTASGAELEKITGVGPTLAQKIIDYRTQHGLFEQIEDIKKVSGIGEVTFEKMKSEITVGEVSPSSSAPASSVATDKININTAGKEELEKITGVGATIAQRIIDYRTLNGPFSQIEDVKNVKGIGEATFEKMKNEISVQ